MHLSEARLPRLLLGFVLLFVQSHAQAHPGHVVVGVERYLTVESIDEGVRFVQSFAFGESAWSELLTNHDRDRNGQLDENEGQEVLREVRKWQPTLQLNGGSVALEQVRGFVAPGGMLGASGTVEIESLVHVGAGPFLLHSFESSAALEDFDRTDVLVRNVGDPATLSGLDGCLRPLDQFQGVTGDFCVSGSARGFALPLWFALLALVTVLSLIALLVRKWRQSMDSAS